MAKSRQAPDYRPNDEYWTPPELFEALGLTFDIDVAAPTGGVPWIPAREHYDKAANGLVQPWRGSVFMNPPFSETRLWVERWLVHRRGIAIVPTSRARWFGELWNSEAAICHPTSKPMFQFVHNGERRNIYMPVVVAAFGHAETAALPRLGRVR